MSYAHLVLYILLVLVFTCEAGITINANSEFIVENVRDFTCSSEVNLSRRQTSFHQWNHIYAKAWSGFDGIITNYMQIEAAVSTYTITLEKFDNLSAIYSNYQAYDKNNNILMSTQIQCSGNQHKNVLKLVDNGFYEYTIDNTVTYSDKSVKFSCQQYSLLSNYVYIAWINTQGNQITVLNVKPSTDFKLLKHHNGLMLCCIYYVETRVQNTVKIKRFVKNKTLFVFKEELPQNSVTADTSDGSTTKNYSDLDDYISPTSEDTNSVTDEKADKENPKGNRTDLSNAEPKSETKNETEKIDTNKKTEITIKTTNERDDDKTNAKTKNPVLLNTDDNIPDSNNKTEDITNNNDGDISSHIDNNGNNSGISNVNNMWDASKAKNTSYTRNGTETGIPVSGEKHSSQVIVLITSITAALVILVVSIVLIRKRCLKKARPAPRPQMQLPRNEAETPFYLNLLLRRECEQEIAAEEQHLYEEVIYH